MARPTKKGLDYFPLDCKMNEEVDLIISDFGIEGYGVLISMFQFIYSQGYYTKWTTREQKLFSKKVGLSLELSNSIINECLNWDIFNNAMFDKYQILTSRRLQDNYVTATYKRVDVEMDPNYLMIDISDKNNVCIRVSDVSNSDVSRVSDGKSTQSKVEGKPLLI